MTKGQTGVYLPATGAGAVEAEIVRVRGACQVDIDIGGTVLQMVNVGIGPGLFEPHGFELPTVLARTVPERLVPRYIPIWHAVVLGVPVAAGTAILTVLAWLRFMN